MAPASLAKRRAARALAHWQGWAHAGGLTGEGLDARLAPGHHGDARHADGKLLVDAHEAHGLLLGLLGSGVRRVALLQQASRPGARRNRHG